MSSIGKPKTYIIYSSYIYQIGVMELKFVINLTFAYVILMGGTPKAMGGKVAWYSVEYINRMLF